MFYTIYYELFLFFPRSFFFSFRLVSLPQRWSNSMRLSISIYVRMKNAYFRWNISNLYCQSDEIQTNKFTSIIKCGISRNNKNNSSTTTSVEKVHTLCFMTKSSLETINTFHNNISCCASECGGTNFHSDVVTFSLTPLALVAQDNSSIFRIVWII